MISYKVKGIILAVILSLASIMMPFSVYADTIDSHIIGRNISYEFIQGDQYNGYAVNQSVFHVEIVLDGYYIGYMQPNFTLQYYNYFYGSNPPAWNTVAISFTNRVFINGNTVNFDIPVKWNSLAIGQSQGGTSPYFYDSYTITSSDVTAYGEIESLSQIIDILNENQDIIFDIYNELLNVVSNTSLANTYLDTITKMRQFNIPIESYGFITYSLQNYYQYLYSFQNLYYYQFPVYRINTEITLYQIWLNSNKTYDLIFIDNFNTWSQASFLQHYYLDGVTINSFSNTPISQNMNIVHVNFTTNSNSWYYLKSRYTYNIDFIPIYFNESSNKNISTDFAIRFGLRNELLDNIEIIANGTTQSNSASSDLESEASEYSEIADDVIGVEEGLTSNFETEVNKIDLNTGLNVFGGNFMTSATWVRTQFDRLTENTPYGSLVVYGLTLGFALLMLGKVFL